MYVYYIILLTLIDTYTMNPTNAVIPTISNGEAVIKDDTEDTLNSRTCPELDVGLALLGLPSTPRSTNDAVGSALGPSMSVGLAGTAGLGRVSVELIGAFVGVDVGVSVGSPPTSLVGFASELGAGLTVGAGLMVGTGTTLGDFDGVLDGTIVGLASEVGSSPSFPSCGGGVGTGVVGAAVVGLDVSPLAGGAVGGLVSVELFGVPSVFTTSVAGSPPLFPSPDGAVVFRSASVQPATKPDSSFLLVSTIQEDGHCTLDRGDDTLSQHPIKSPLQKL
jgi:hypothetical protein